MPTDRSSIKIASPDLLRRVRIEAGIQDRDMQDIIGEALHEWVARHGTPEGGAAARPLMFSTE